MQTQFGLGSSKSSAAEVAWRTFGPCPRVLMGCKVVSPKNLVLLTKNPSVLSGSSSVHTYIILYNPIYIHIIYHTYIYIIIYIYIHIHFEVAFIRSRAWLSGGFLQTMDGWKLMLIPKRVPKVLNHRHIRLPVWSHSLLRGRRSV